MLAVSIFGWLLSVSFVGALNCVSVLCVLLVWGLVDCYGSFLGPTYSGLWLSGEGLSGVLVCLSVWVSMLMYLVSSKNGMFFNLMVGVLLEVVVLFFLVDHVMLFYVLFEASLLPTLFLVLKWGYQPERVQAGTYFIMYTVCASLPLLVVVLSWYESVQHYVLSPLCPLVSGMGGGYSWGLQVCFYTAFLVKVPMWGVHLWLPKAHVEAPVTGSMVLAGVLLKLGGYGLMKIYLLTLGFTGGALYFFCAVSLWGSVAVSFVCMRQVDVKSLIAYSSVVHMALMVLGVLSGSVSGWVGAGLMMVAHGLSSPGLFVMANYNYMSVGSRNMLLHKGLSMLYPSFAMLWFVLLAANMAAPPSLNLAAELLICGGVLKLGWGLAVILGMCTFMAAAYNLYVYSSQQGNLGVNVCSNQVWSSNYVLVGVLHGIPVYGLILAMGSFC